MRRDPSLPYCTVKGFKKCLAVLRQPDAPQRINRQNLEAAGMSHHAVYPVLGALRYLSMIDAEGRLTEAAAPFLSEELSGRDRVVTEAYSALLRSLDLPVSDRDPVDKLLVEKHGCAPGVAAFCSTFFLWIAAEAGLPVARLDRQRRGRPPAHVAELSATARTALLAAQDGDADSRRELEAIFASRDAARSVDARPAAEPRAQEGPRA